MGEEIRVLIVVHCEQQCRNIYEGDMSKTLMKKQRKILVVHHICFDKRFGPKFQQMIWSKNVHLTLQESYGQLQAAELVSICAISLLPFLLNV